MFGELGDETEAMTKKTDEQFKTEAEPYVKKHNGKLLGVVRKKNKATRIKVQCEKRHHPWLLTLTTLKKGCWCPACSGRGRPDKEYIAIALPYIKKHNGLFLEFIHAKGKKPAMFKIKCKNGHVFLKNLSHLKEGGWCGKCYNRGLSREESITRVIPYVKEHNGSFLQLVRNKNKIRDEYVIRCKYGHKFKTTFNHLKNDRWCPRCASSQGEKLLALVFEQNNIPYTREHGEIINGKLHKFDYVIRNNSNKNTKQFTFIEWDGIQHFPDIEKGKNRLYQDPSYPRRDKAKDKWCEQHGYNIIRFNYKYKVEDVLYKLSLFCGYHSLKMPDLTVEPLFKRKKEMAGYYINHSGQQTSNIFHCSVSHVQRTFKEIYGKTKNDMLLNQRKSEIARYYIDHSVKETAKKFKIGECTVQHSFKKVYGMTKRNYLKKHNLMNKNISSNKRIAVIGTNSLGNNIFFKSQNEASRYLEIPNSSQISIVLHGGCETVHGYYFRFATSEEIKAQKPLPQSSKQLQLNLNEVKNIS